MPRPGSGKEYRVSFDLGAATDSPPAVMDTRLRSKLMTLLDRPARNAEWRGSRLGYVREGRGAVGHDPGPQRSWQSQPRRGHELDDFAVGPGRWSACYWTSPCDTPDYGRHGLCHEACWRAIGSKSIPIPGWSYWMRHRLDAVATRYFAPVAKRATVITADVTQPQQWRDALAAHDITHIVHARP